MITKHEAINTMDPKVWDVIDEMQSIIADNYDEYLKDANLSLEEKVVMNRYLVTLSAILTQTSLINDPAQRFSLVAEGTELIEQIVYSLVALGKGLLPLDKFENVPEWVKAAEERTGEEGHE